MSVTPGAHDAKEAEGRSDSASSARPKSVRFGDEVAAVEPQPQSKAAASLEAPTESDFENAQVGPASCCSRVSRCPKLWQKVPHSCHPALLKKGRINKRCSHADLGATDADLLHLPRDSCVTAEGY